MYVAFILRCVVVVGEGFAYGLIVFLGLKKKKKLFLQPVRVLEHNLFFLSSM